MMNKAIAISAVLTTMLLSGCTQSLENTYSAQEGKIDSFLESARKNILDSAPAEGEDGYEEYQELLANGMGNIIYNRNSNRLILVPGTGTSLTASGKTTIYYALYTFSGSLSAKDIVATNHEETAAESNWELTNPSYDPITLDLRDKNMIEGLRNGLEGVRAGEECYIVFSGKYGYGNKVHGNIPVNSALLYHIRVLSVE